jgi:hypothetical protein
MFIVSFFSSFSVDVGEEAGFYRPAFLLSSSLSTVLSTGKQRCFRGTLSGYPLS